MALLLASSAAAADGDRPRGDRGSRLGHAGTVAEFWDLTARLDSGHLILARFSITNEGPGERNAFAVGHVLAPDGGIAKFRNGRLEGRWSLASDGLGIEIGGSKLDLHAPESRLWIDKRSKGVELDLRFAAGKPGAPGLDPPFDGYRVDLLELGRPVRGTLWTEGMAEPLAVSGTLALTHTWTRRPEAELALRRIELVALEPGAALYVSELTRPGGERSRWFALARGGEVVKRGSGFELSVEPREGADGAYPLPAGFALAGDGLAGEVRLGPLRLEYDPLDDLPGLVRWIMARESKPRRLWSGAAFEVRAAGEVLRGDDGVAALTYLNRMGR